MGIFDNSNYIVNTGIIEQVFQCTSKMICWRRWSNCGHSMRMWFTVSDALGSITEPVGTRLHWSTCSPPV